MRVTASSRLSPEWKFIRKGIDSETGQKSTLTKIGGVVITELKDWNNPTGHVLHIANVACESWSFAFGCRL